MCCGFAFLIAIFFLFRVSMIDIWCLTPHKVSGSSIWEEMVHTSQQEILQNKYCLGIKHVPGFLL